MGSILLGQPIGWLCSDVTVCTYLLIFALSYSRFTRDIFRFIVNLEPFATIISVVDDMSWGNCITMLGVQRALNPMHAASPVKNSASAAILLGTLAGCGGGLLRSDKANMDAFWTRDELFVFLSSPLLSSRSLPLCSVLRCRPAPP